VNKDETMPIHELIHDIRGQKVMLDSDLAGLYQVEVKVLNRAVKRNIKRFPIDFMFQLAVDEWNNLKCQNGASSWGGRRKLPYAFSEQGIAMLSGLLSSDIAIEVNIQIMRAFVEMRRCILPLNGSNEQISELRKLLMLHIENNDAKFSEHDEAIRQIIRVLNRLIEKPKEPIKIGFNAQ